MKRFLSLLLLSLVFLGCQTYSDENLVTFDTRIQEYIEEKGWEMENNGDGLYYSIVDIGDTTKGFIKSQDVVTFAYQCYDLEGNLLDGKPAEDALTFPLSELILGWKEALMMIHDKGEINIVIPPQKAYGAKADLKIPKNSCLYYKIQVLDVI